MNLFDNGLIYEHFTSSFELVRSMTEPIRFGDKALLFKDGQWSVDASKVDCGLDAFYHPYILILPERFQKSADSKCRFDALELDHRSDCSVCFGSWNH